MAWGLAIGAIASLAGGAISGAGAAKGARAELESREQAITDFLARQDSLLSGAAGNEDIFGRKPEGFLYDPVDITQSQLDAIAGNQKALPGAIDLASGTNASIIQNDLNRVRSLVPNYDQNINQLGEVSRDLLFGRLPFSDVLDIASDRAELSSSLGIAGGDAPATLKDLGLSRLQAQQQGAQLFQGMIQSANQVSPISSQLRPQSQFLDPQNRLNADILQRQLLTDSIQQREFLDAAPDPGAAAIFNAQYAGNLATIGGATGSGGAGLGLQGLGQGISASGALLSNYFQGQQQAQATEAYRSKVLEQLGKNGNGGNPYSIY